MEGKEVISRCRDARGNQNALKKAGAEKLRKKGRLLVRVGGKWKQLPHSKTDVKAGRPRRRRKEKTGEMWDRRTIYLEARYNFKSEEGMLEGATRERPQDRKFV